MRGKVIIDSPVITFGMIRLGIFITNQYPNSGIRWHNQGTIVFKGRAAIGANSAITVLRENSYLEFGDNFGNAASLRLNCDYRIIFCKNVRIGWDVSVMDSAMHRIKDLDGNFLGKGYEEVIIEENVCIASQCLILQGTRVPAYSIVAARSLLNKYYDIPTYSLLAGIPARLIKTGVYRDINDDKILI